MFQKYVVYTILLILLNIISSESANILENNINSSYTKCPQYYWPCNSGQCIRNEEVCDGTIHCTDRSDETVEQCLQTLCPKYAFQCTYGACITGNFKCNGIKDCVDGSDETMFLCNTNLNYTKEIQGKCNSSSTMQCKSGKCINSDKVCDGFKDCSDGSDESVEICSFSLCPIYSFRCGYGACIAGAAKCNGIPDCMDGSDELPSICEVNLKPNVNESDIRTTTAKPFRTTFATTTPRPTQQLPTSSAPTLRPLDPTSSGDSFPINCSSKAFGHGLSSPNNNLNIWSCANGQNIRNEDVCDGSIHCADRSDETVELCLLRPCPKYAFQCAYGACITGNFKCNGVVNCADGSDETKFLCNPNLNYTEEIQGNCPSQSTMQCKSGECINNDKVCDGSKDCSDGSDELVEICSFLKCPEYSFRCGYGACIAGSAKCNGIVDCMDGSDELPSICANNDCGYTINATFTTTAKPVATSTSTSEISPTTPTNPLFTSTTVPTLASTTTDRSQDTNIFCSPSTLTRGISTIASCSYNNISTSCYHNLRPGTRANISCASGYIKQKFKLQDHTLICDNDGEWNYSKLKCSPDCGTLTMDQQNKPIKPWDITIFKRGYTGQYTPICSGVIVSPKVVLTAANCFLSRPDGYTANHVIYNVVEGFFNYTYSQGEHLNVKVHNISNLSITTSPKSESLAILILVNYFNFSNYVKPICLPSIRHKIPLLLDNRFNIGRAVTRDRREYLEHLIANVDYTYSAQSAITINYVNVVLFMPQINREIKKYQYLL